MYKLIGENSKLISNSSNYLQLNSLFSTLEECIKSKGITGFSTYSDLDVLEFNFGNSLNGCEISTSSSTGVVIDNIEYILEGKIIDKEVEYIDWVLKIEGEGVGTSTGTFKLIN